MCEKALKTLKLLLLASFNEGVLDLDCLLTALDIRYLQACRKNHIFAECESAAVLLQIEILITISNFYIEA